MSKKSIRSRTRFLDGRVEGTPTLIAELLRYSDVRINTRGLLPCRVEDPDLWFAACPREVERAKGLCAGCPIRDACLTGALERRESWGVWGGQLIEQGRVVERKRSRGRPRKDGREPRPTQAPDSATTTAAASVSTRSRRRPEKKSRRNRTSPRHPPTRRFEPSSSTKEP